MRRVGDALKFMFCLCIMLLSAEAVRSESLSSEEAARLLSEANTFFREANETAARDPKTSRDLYRRAVLRFERLVREGKIENGKLYYNIGNAYFRLDDPGRAVLNYLRAKKYIPNDSNLMQNLKYARSRRADKVEEKQETKVLKTLLFWHYDLSYNLRRSIFIIFFLLLWVGASCRLFKKNLIPRSFLTVCAVIAVLFLASISIEGFSRQKKRRGVIIAAEVVARKGDGTSFQPSFKNPLHSGVEFILIEKRNNWFQVELQDGRQCWIPEVSAEFVRRD